MNKKQAIHALPEATTRFYCPDCIKKGKNGWMVKNKKKGKFQCQKCGFDMSLEEGYNYIEKRK